MKLKDYFTLHCVNKTKWCSKHGISRQTINLIERGGVPTLDMAIKVYKATNREVSPKDMGVLP